MPNFANPQSLNRFSYVLNAPLKYVDPSGHRESCAGTDAFISESTGDGGISWASCWARQRDEKALTDQGIPEIIAEIVAIVKDTLGTFEGIVYLTSSGQINLIDLAKGKQREDENDDNGGLLIIPPSQARRDETQEKDENPASCAATASSPFSFGSDIHASHSISCAHFVSNLQMTGALIRTTADGASQISTIENWECAGGQQTQGCVNESTAPKIRGWWYATTSGTYEYRRKEYNVPASPPVLWVLIK